MTNPTNKRGNKMKTLTVDDVMKMEPCGWDDEDDGTNYTRKRVSALWAGRKRLSLLEVLDLGIPVDDRLWCVMHALDNYTARVFACDLAGHVLHIFEANYPDDRRPRECLETIHRCLRGEASKDELATAADAAAAASNAAWATAAWGASRAASWAAWAAADAAWGAAWAAAYVAGRAAASAAGAAEHDWQLSRVREGLMWIEEHE